METTAVGTVGLTESGQNRTGINRMTSEDFFALLVTELQQQDPFEPAKTGDMIGQVSQIRSIELSSQLTSVLEQLNRQQRTLGASELLGKLVEAQVVQLDGSRIQVAGLVTAVRFGTDGVAVLELDSGQAVRAADVTRVTAADAQASGKSAAGAA